MYVGSIDGLYNGVLVVSSTVDNRRTQFSGSIRLQARGYGEFRDFIALLLTGMVNYYSANK